MRVGQDDEEVDGKLNMGICIYCRKESSASRSKAHIVPEAFLRNDVTLPLGAECDTCNGYASKLEQAFIHHNRIWTQIMMLRAPGKKGKKRKRMSYYSVNDEQKVMKVQFRNSWLTEHEGIRKVVFPDPAEFDESKFRRCLGHISLNYIAWKFGWEVALKSRFDPLREYVRYGSQTMMWPYGQVSYEDSQPRRKLSIGWEPDAPGLTVKFESYIDDFYIDTLNTGELDEWMASLEGKEVLYFI